MTPLALLIIIAAYLLGSISSAVLICRLYGLPDPRDTGSGNPGATNVLRLGGRGAAAMRSCGSARDRPGSTRIGSMQPPGTRR